MTGHRLISDADLAGSRPVTEAELAMAIAAVYAMTDAEFLAAAERVGRQVHEATS